MGDLDLLSNQTKAINPITPTITANMILAELHGNMVPPIVMPRRRDIDDIASIAIPPKSISHSFRGGCRADAASLKDHNKPMKETQHTGRLIQKASLQLAVCPIAPPIGS